MEKFLELTLLGWSANANDSAFWSGGLIVGMILGNFLFPFLRKLEEKRIKKLVDAEIKKRDGGN